MKPRSSESLPVSNLNFPKSTMEVGLLAQSLEPSSFPVLKTPFYHMDPPPSPEKALESKLLPLLDIHHLPSCSPVIRQTLQRASHTLGILSFTLLLPAKILAIFQHLGQVAPSNSLRLSWLELTLLFFTSLWIELWN
jgi:hypothetical protein